MHPYTAEPVIVSAPELASRLKRRMEEQGVSVRDLAEKSGVNKDTISEWRQGRTSSVRLELAARVAQSLQTSAPMLLDLPPPPPPGPESRGQGQIEPLVLRLLGLIDEVNGVIEEVRGVGA